jgi:hypothetical protein
MIVRSGGGNEKRKNFDAKGAKEGKGALRRIWRFVACFRKPGTAAPNTETRPGGKSSGARVREGAQKIFANLKKALATI